MLRNITTLYREQTIMTTYLILNLAFLVIAGIMLHRHLKKPSHSWILMLLILLLLTAIFDSMIIAAGIVGYDQGKLLGVYIGRAPIEDFFYALLAAVVVPALWNSSKKENV
ncbi:TPA: lycopene cyclase domain-containing protein [Candidatus Saccharibacteria bacterium]|nr:lycopene cyclase domain-containing protein [Candidatus Saccharibacteria bacterium]